MKQKTFILLILALITQCGFAQAPKWVEKAKRAVFSVVTYGADDKILNTGNAFFVSDNGVALSDYSLFKGAKRAVAINSQGEQMPVEAIMGANEIYDVIKFRVAVTGKKVQSLPIATTSPTANTPIYLLPYSTQKDRTYTGGTVTSVDQVEGGYSYYTLALRLKEKMVSCPLVNEHGQVFGLAQKASGQDTATICYAVSADFVMAQSINALSYNDDALNNIGIKKALPETEEQALVFLYMASSQLSADRYAEVLNDYVDQYPQSADGYLRRATHQMALSQDDASMQKVESDMNKALEVGTVKDDVYYNRSKLVYNYCLQAPEAPYQGWNFDKALDEIRQAYAIQALPIYKQFEGDIYFAKQDYTSALTAYELVNQTPLASPTTFFSAAQCKRLMQRPAEEVVALIDSCVARFTQPYTAEAAPYLLERAQARVDAGQARAAMVDFDAYFNAVNGNVNDLFYYYREQAAVKAKQFQRALNDIATAIELNPNDLTYRAEQAAILIRIGRYEQAIETLQQAIAIDANYAEAYRFLGIAQNQLKRNKEACASFAKAKELGDPNADALIEKYCK